MDKYKIHADIIYIIISMCACFIKEMTTVYTVAYRSEYIHIETSIMKITIFKRVYQTFLLFGIKLIYQKNTITQFCLKNPFILIYGVVSIAISTHAFSV